MEEKKLEQGFNHSPLEISEKSKEALHSETWNEVRQGMKKNIPHFTYSPEIQHFAVESVRENDNAYGIGKGNLIREYLQTAYSSEDAEAEVVSDGVTYKVLKREEVTVFYDVDGNTLFDVENKRLEKDYEYVMDELKKSSDEPVKEDSVTKKETKPASPEEIKKQAKKKLESELKKAADKSFAEPIIEYLLKRCEEDLGLAEDVVQDHKTYKKCFDYIYAQARANSKGTSAYIRDEVVYEWAEDYYHKDDKAEEEKKAKEAEERKKKAEERRKKAAEKKQQEPKKKEQKEKKKDEPKKTEAPKPKKNSKEIDGQMDFFSMMGM
ncbi:MAG: hypothetical protein IJ733_21440 [Lachnospiraceae bacterium]|nr:hypothetical protein [Lachnospiraceae bacterium]